MLKITNKKLSKYLSCKPYTLRELYKIEETYSAAGYEVEYIS